MKTRNGFVSNSSSSSFVIYIKDEKMSLEERKAKTIKTMKDWCFPDDEEEQEYNEKQAQKLAEEGRYMAVKKSVERGGEEAIDEIIPEILEVLGIEDGKFEYEWIDE
jgi:hypothetical protein